MTRTTPFRRTILQFSQIRLTLLRTFMMQILLAARFGPKIRRIRLYSKNPAASQASEIPASVPAPPFSLAALRAHPRREAAAA